MEEQEMYTWQQIQEGRAVLGVPYNVRRISLRARLLACPPAQLPANRLSVCLSVYLFVCGLVSSPKVLTENFKTRCVKADSHIACRAHAVPLPCRAAKGLECVFPI